VTENKQNKFWSNLCDSIQNVSDGFKAKQQAKLEREKANANKQREAAAARQKEIDHQIREAAARAHVSDIEEAVRVSHIISTPDAHSKIYVAVCAFVPAVSAVHWSPPDPMNSCLIKIRRQGASRGWLDSSLTIWTNHPDREAIRDAFNGDREAIGERICAALGLELVDIGKADMHGKFNISFGFTSQTRLHERHT
jgi:hypothetical protein